MSPQEAFGIALILVALAAPVIVISVVYYFKKRFEHRQIMAAIEKGTPLSELKPPKQKQNGALWIRNLTIGIALLTIAVVLFLLKQPDPGEILIVVLFAVGIAWVVRGILNRKYQAQIQPTGKNHLAKNKDSASISTSVSPEQTDEQSGPKV